MEKKRKWSVEYSISQDCFHVDDLENVLKINTSDMISKNNWTDYKIIGIFNTQEEATEYASECRRKIEMIKNENV